MAHASKLVRSAATASKAFSGNKLRLDGTFLATIGATSALMVSSSNAASGKAGDFTLSLAPQIAAPTTSEDLPRDIIELVSAISSLPAEHRLRLAPLVDKVVESTSRRRRILNLVQDALGQLRLDMKYLIFDLEATRRERDDLRTRDDNPSEGFE
jgi:hypothetical protein